MLTNVEALILLNVIGIIVCFCIKSVRARLQELPYVKRAFILFDGECVMCNGFVDICIARAPEHPMKVASLKSDFGLWLCKVHGISLPPSSFVYIEEIEDNPITHYAAHCRVSQRSDAALLSLSALGPSMPWVLMAIFQPVPAFLRDFIYDLGWKYRRQVFGTASACRKRSGYDIDSGGPTHTCEASTERRGVLAECADPYDIDEEEDWIRNVLSRYMVVYDSGIVRREGGASPATATQRAARSPSRSHPATPAPPPVVSRDELATCRRLAMEAAQLLEDIRLNSEASSRWSPFFIIRDPATMDPATDSARAREGDGSGAPKAITEAAIRKAFGGCIFPLAPVSIEPLGGERAAWWRHIVSSSSGSMEQWPMVTPNAQFLQLSDWFNSQPGLLCGPAVVAIGEFEHNYRKKAKRPPQEQVERMGCTMPRFVMAYTPAGSLIGVCACEVHT